MIRRAHHLGSLGDVDPRVLDLSYLERLPNPELYVYTFFNTRRIVCQGEETSEAFLHEWWAVGSRLTAVVKGIPASDSFRSQTRFIDIDSWQMPGANERTQHPYQRRKIMSEAMQEHGRQVLDTQPPCRV
jgi:hypothetical protein